MIKYLKQNKGVAFLPVVLLINGLAIIIVTTLVLIVTFVNNSNARTKWSTEALAIGQTGIDEGIIKIVLMYLVQALLHFQ